MITLTVYIFALISENQVKRSKILVNGWNETKNVFNDLIKSSLWNIKYIFVSTKRKTPWRHRNEESNRRLQIDKWWII